MEYLFYLIIGAFAGLLSGLLGIGGGIIIVPALILVLQHQVTFNPADIMHIAVGTSLATMILTSLSSSLAYQRRKAIVWPIFWPMLPGLSVGMVLGSLLTAHLNNTILVNAFSVFLMINALHLFINAQQADASKQSSKDTHHHFLIIITSIFVGLLSALFGIGGGILMVPLFLMLGLSMHQASGTSSICGMIVAMMGTVILSHATLQSLSHSNYPHMFGYIYWPAAAAMATSSMICTVLGTRLAFKLPIAILKRLFAILLLLCAWDISSF